MDLKNQKNAAYYATSPQSGIFSKTGALGFEPRNVETKTRCLTTWRRPINPTFIIIADDIRILSTSGLKIKQADKN